VSLGLMQLQEDNRLRSHLTGAPYIRKLDLTRVDDAVADTPRSHVTCSTSGTTGTPSARGMMEATLVHGSSMAGGGSAVSVGSDTGRSRVKAEAK
jgi:hypothetical protein